MTQFEHQVHEEEDIKDILIEDPEPEGHVQNFIAAHKLKRTIQKPALYI